MAPSEWNDLVDYRRRKEGEFREGIQRSFEIAERQRNETLRITADYEARRRREDEERNRREQIYREQRRREAWTGFCYEEERRSGRRLYSSEPPDWFRGW